MTKLRGIQVNVLDKIGRPIKNIDVAAIALSRFNQIDEVESVEITNAAGTCYFDLDEPCAFRIMLSPMLKREVRIQILPGGAMGIIKHYIVDADGFGTHTTVQAAFTAGIAAFGATKAVVIYVNPGEYREEVVVNGSGGERFFLVAEGAVATLRSGFFAATATIRSPSAEAAPVITMTGGGSLSVHGLRISAEGAQMAFDIATNVKLEVRNSLVDSESGYCFDSTADVHCQDAIIIASNSRALGHANQTTFEHCYINADGLFRGDYGNLHLKDCILFGDAPAGEYWIEEVNLVTGFGLEISGCKSSAGGGAGFLLAGEVGATERDLRLVNNEMAMGASEICFHLVGINGGVVVGNVIQGANNADGSTAIKVSPSTGPIACKALVVANNSIRAIQNGLVVDANASDGYCVFGPNAYGSDVGTATAGVPDTENYQVTMDDAGGVSDAADLTYTPTTAADWDSDADPGDQDEANDQLAERITDLEERGVFEYGSSATAVFGASGAWYPNTPFIGSVNGNPTSTSVVYNVTSGEASMFRGQVLHNTTKGEKVYIESVNYGTNTATVEANSPDDADTWDNADVLTTASQTNTGRTGVFVDIDVTPHIAGAGVPNGVILAGYTALQNADIWFLITHPYEAYNVDKENTIVKQSVAATAYHQVIVPVTAEGGRYYFTLCLLALLASNAGVLFRWSGQFTKMVA